MEIKKQVLGGDINKLSGFCEINESSNLRGNYDTTLIFFIYPSVLVFPVKREFHVFKLQTEREMKQKDGAKSTERVRSAPIR